MEQDVSGRAQEKEYLHAHLKAFTFVANAPVEAQQVPQCWCRLRIVPKVGNVQSGISICKRNTKSPIMLRRAQG